MQIVVSSFESVAGLSSSTPYVATALKSVTRHFKCLKSAILDQIKHTGEVLGEDLSGSSSGTGSKLDIDMARLRYADQSFQKNKTGFLEPQQQAWRPQRGLPERAVAILKAWLFEHFLHPYVLLSALPFSLFSERKKKKTLNYACLFRYPTDTDKHMLASQTGLSRNQVGVYFFSLNYYHVSIRLLFVRLNELSIDTITWLFLFGSIHQTKCCSIYFSFLHKLSMLVWY